MSSEPEVKGFSDKEIVNCPQPTIILRARGLSKSFPGVHAVENVSLEVYRGEINGLVGKNGAGKSTLVRLLMGLQRADGGTVEIGGRCYEAMTPDEALEAGIAYVPQQVSMIDSLTVAENILAGNLPAGKFGFINWKEVKQEAKRRLQKLSLEIDVRQRVDGLNITEQTMLAIAKALFSRAKLIILDEPTAALPKVDIQRMFSFIRSMKQQGVGFIYISHHLEEIFEICDRVSVLRDGQMVGNHRVAEINQTQLIQMMVGQSVSEFSRANNPISKEVVLSIENLVRRGHYEKINMSIRKGEVVGLTGLKGSGSEALAAGLFGLEYLGRGTVKLNGKAFIARTPRQALGQRLAYLPADRHRFGIVGLRSVKENITYSILKRLVRLFMIINDRRETELVSSFIKDLGIVTHSIEQKVGLLSGGNQQKVVFSKLVATKPSLLILHEPTQGIDVDAKTDIFRVIDDLSSQGVATLLISNEVRELSVICDRILVMCEGKITYQFIKGDAEAIPENILLAIEGSYEPG